MFVLIKMFYAIYSVGFLNGFLCQSSTLEIVGKFLTSVKAMRPSCGHLTYFLGMHRNAFNTLKNTKQIDLKVTIFQTQN